MGISCYGSNFHFFLTTEELGKEVAESLNKSGMSGQVLFVKCDISNEDDVKVI